MCRAHDGFVSWCEREARAWYGRRVKQKAGRKRARRTERYRGTYQMRDRAETTTKDAFSSKLRPEERERNGPAQAFFETDRREP